jgi:hypothetical protein
MKLKLKKRKAYGHVRLYPDCETSKMLAELRGGTCFDEAALELLKRLGYTYTIKSED